MTEPLPADLLAVLVCPVTRAPLEQHGDELVATRPAGAGLRYPVRDGIPVMLDSEARLPEGVDSLETFRRRFAGDLPREPEGTDATGGGG